MLRIHCVCIDFVTAATVLQQGYALSCVMCSRCTIVLAEILCRLFSRHSAMNMV